MRTGRKERVAMCQKIREIHGLTPVDILSAHLNSAASFVDVQDVLDKMGIPCMKVDFSGLEKELHLPKDDAIWGLAASRGEELIIAYSKKLDFPMKNYVLAHELGHCCLHLPISAEFHVELKHANDVYSDSLTFLRVPSWIRTLVFLRTPSRIRAQSKEFSQKESEADEFATQLLLPDTLLHKYRSRGSPLTAQSLSKDFKIPIRFARDSIEYMKQDDG